MDNSLYERPLETFKSSLHYHETEGDQLLTESVMGNIHFELKDLVKSDSDEVFSRISDKIFESGDIYQKEIVLK